jgi:hypothetical protein
MFTHASRLTHWARYGGGGYGWLLTYCKIMVKKHIRQKSYCLYKMGLN